MTKLTHHPRSETLAEFAAGHMDEARAFVIAAHASLCPQCAQDIEMMEVAGGALLESGEMVEMSPDALEKIFAAVDPASVAGAASSLGKPVKMAPSPLEGMLPGSLEDVRWRPVAPGISQSVIEASGYRKGALRLLRIQPGTRLPTHSHKGEELTLILRGAYEDEVGTFAAGDLADLDGAHTHEPRATGDTPCICLIATNAPLAFKSIIGRIAQPFVGL